MSKVRTFNLEVERGTSASFTIDYTDPLTNLPIDLTGYDAFFRAKKTGYVNYELTKNVQSGVVINPSVGEVTVSLSPADTELVTWDRLEYSLLISSGGLVTKILKGFITLLD